MNCFLITGAPCVFQQSRRTDMFEVHVTITSSDFQELQDFYVLCKQHQWKSIVIDLGLAIPTQPMTCSRIIGTIPEAYAHADFVRTQLEAVGLRVSRVKIEAAPWNSHVPHNAQERLQQHSSAYFEYHAKLHLPIDGWQVTLAPVCSLFNAHLSRNVLRQNDDQFVERFVTIRSDSCGLDTFQQHTQQFEHMLQYYEFSLLSTVTEYCMYDSNVTLDAIWQTLSINTHSASVK